MSHSSARTRDPIVLEGGKSGGGGGLSGGGGKLGGGGVPGGGG